MASVGARAYNRGLGAKPPTGIQGGIAIPGSWIRDLFSIPKYRDYERPNPGISGLENNVLTLLLRVKCMH